MKKLQKRKGAWFVPVRGSYLPASWQGLVLYFIFVAYLIASTVIIISQHHASIAYLGLQLLVQWVVATVIITWIAQRKS
jgi:hypothetical protein